MNKTMLVNYPNTVKKLANFVLFFPVVYCMILVSLTLTSFRQAPVWQVWGAPQPSSSQSARQCPLPYRRCSQTSVSTAPGPLPHPPSPLHNTPAEKRGGVGEMVWNIMTCISIAKFMSLTSVSKLWEEKREKRKEKGGGRWKRVGNIAWSQYLCDIVFKASKNNKQQTK